MQRLRQAARLTPLAGLLLLGACNTVVMHPAGDVAAQESHLIVVATMLMLIIIIPVILLTILFAWRYRHGNKDAAYEPDWNHSTQLELVIWGAPLLIIIALGLVTWISTHTLDPYRSLQRLDATRPVPIDVRPMTVEVVALDWKWLFIYPEQGIATVNELVTPVDMPVRFKITASSVMNAFYVPAMSGMIYAMPGMETSLHAVLNKPGTYEGLSANYSGAGFSDMHFKVHGVSEKEFARWVETTKAGGGSLDRAGYLDLEKPSVREPVHHYAKVAPDLYAAIVNRCVAPGQPCIDPAMASVSAPQAGHAMPGMTDTGKGPAEMARPMGVTPNVTPPDPKYAPGAAPSPSEAAAAEAKSPAAAPTKPAPPATHLHHHE